MKKHLKEWLARFSWAALGAFGFFAVQVIVSPDPQGEPIYTSNLDTVARCLPGDEGEKSILWLDNEWRRGLVLHCEKHQMVQWPSVELSPPVSVE